MAGPNWHLADDRKTVTVSFPSDPPVALKLESRDTRGWLGKLFGKGSAAALLLAVFLIGGTAWAAEYTVFGSGLDSCGSWTAAKEEKSSMQVGYYRWITGYLTAYNLWVEKGSGPVNKLDEPVGAWAWIDNYCQETPLDSVADAAQQLIYAIKAK